MTTKIIDAGVYVRSATYTGPGQVDGHVEKEAGNGELFTGYFTGDGSDYLIYLGKKPRVVEVYDETNDILWIKWDTMAAANTLKDGTKDTGSAIVLVDGGSGNYRVSIPAATAPSAAKICFKILC